MHLREKKAGFSTDALEVVRLFSIGLAMVCERTALSLWESRALRPGEGLLNLQASDRFDSFKHALPGRYRVRPSRREGDLNPNQSTT
jgi:hypothetical protein